MRMRWGRGESLGDGSWSLITFISSTEKKNVKMRKTFLRKGIFAPFVVGQSQHRIWGLSAEITHRAKIEGVWGVSGILHIICNENMRSNPRTSRPADYWQTEEEISSTNPLITKWKNLWKLNCFQRKCFICKMILKVLFSSKAVTAITTINFLLPSCKTWPWSRTL